jgi:glutathione synthase/RimK-type ligase-like ATP-grasp enzyme
VILAISYPGEEHTAAVVRLLESAGREVRQLDLSDFPASAGLSLSWSDDGRPRYLVEPAGGAFDLSDVRVAWWRRVRAFTIDAAVTDPSRRAFAESETSQAVNGMLNSLSCAWVNPRAADDAAHQKPLQWHVAHELGLRLPRTLVTNQPQAAREFVQAMGVGKTIFKAFLASIEDWRETRLVQAEDLERLEQVKYAPVIFQEYIEGVDLRITVIGGEIFAAEIDARHTSYPVDMRMAIGESLIKPVTLPSAVSEALLALQRRLGLHYGAIDMRRTHAGEYYFLEVNPAGQWLFVEDRTGMQISQAMADYLAALHDSSSVK